MTQTLEKTKYSIKTDFSLLSILLIPIGVALNVVGDQLVAALSLPLYLDSFGASVAIAGLVAAGANIWKTVLSVDGIVTVFDRIVSHILCYLIILVIPQRTLIKYSCGEQWIRKNKKAVVEDDEE